MGRQEPWRYSRSYQAFFCFSTKIDHPQSRNQEDESDDRQQRSQLGEKDRFLLLILLQHNENDVLAQLCHGSGIGTVIITPDHPVFIQQRDIVGMYKVGIDVDTIL